jgi:hypothetical protein
MNVQTFLQEDMEIHAAQGYKIHQKNSVHSEAMALLVAHFF